MSKYDNKRFYWLKLEEDFLDNDTMQWLEEQENGYKYIVFYIKLCLKSLKTNGVLQRRVGNIIMPYDNKNIAKLTGFDIDTVSVAMSLFVNIGLVRIVENGTIELSTLSSMIGDSSVGAFKKAQQRTMINQGGQMSAKCLPNVCLTEDKCPTEIDIDLELDLEKDRDTDIEPKQEKKKKKSTLTSSPMVIPTLDECICYAYEENLAVDVKSFYTWYSDSEWKDKTGEPVRNWKLKMRTWHKRELDNNPHATYASLNVNSQSQRKSF